MSVLAPERTMSVQSMSPSQFSMHFSKVWALLEDMSPPGSSVSQFTMYPKPLLAVYTVPLLCGQDNAVDVGEVTGVGFAVLATSATTLDVAKAEGRESRRAPYIPDCWDDVPTSDLR